MAKNFSSSYTSVDNTVTSKGNLSPKVSRVLNDIANVASVIPAVADARAALTAAKVGAAGISMAEKAGAERIAAKEAAAPYARSIRGVQGKNANLTLSRGSAKESPANNTKIHLQKVADPASKANMAATRNDVARNVAGARADAAAALATAKGNLIRSAAGAAIGQGVNHARIDAQRSGAAVRQAGTSLNSATNSSAGVPTRGVKQ
jgi:hypothetical protein